MLLYTIPALINPFPDIAFTIKGNANNGRDPPSCPFMSPFSDIAFINEEATGCINEAATGIIIAPRNTSSCFFISFLLFQ